MKLLMYLVVAGYFAIWLALLVHCFRRKEFWPVFGNGLGTKLFWLVTFCFFNPLLTLLYVIFGVFARPTGQPSWARSALVLVPALAIIFLVGWPFGRSGRHVTTARRDPNTGEIVTEGKSDRGIEAQLGIIEAQDGLNATCVSFTGNNPHFPCRRIAILNQSTHPLMRRVGVTVQRELSKLSFVDEVAYYPPGERPPRGGIAPDVYLLLDLPRVRETKLPLFRYLNLGISAVAGTDPYTCNSHYSDHLAPPILEFNWTASLSHRSKTFGYETASAKYLLAANDIAKELAKSLSKQFADWIEKYGPLPALPDSFYGTYREASKPAFLPGNALECLLSARGFMKHNVTMWRYGDDRPTSEALGAIESRMEQEGWRTLSKDFSGGNLSNLKLRKDAERVTVFRQRRDEEFGVWVRTSNGAPPKPMPLIAKYEQEFSNEERDAALRELLDSTATLDTLITFESFFRQGGLRDRYLAALERQPATRAAGSLTLAKVYQGEGEPEKARGALVRAIALLRTEEKCDQYTGRIKDLARKLDEEKLPEQEIPAEILRDLGFIEVTSRPVTLEREAGLGEAVVLYSPENLKRTFCLRIERANSKETKSPYTLKWLRVEDHNRSWGAHGSSVQSSDGRWRASETFTLGDGIQGTADVESLPGERFCFRIRIS